MWLLGLPVITSDTPSYATAMKSLINQRLSINAKDWDNQLRKFIKSSNSELKKELKDIGIKLKKEYSKEKHIKDWLLIFNSLSLDKSPLN